MVAPGDGQSPAPAPTSFTDRHHTEPEVSARGPHGAGAPSRSAGDGRDPGAPRGDGAGGGSVARAIDEARAGGEARQALAGAAKRGDPDAWEAIYRAVYPRLRAYAARRVGPGQAEDMVNETMTRAVGAINRFEWGPAGLDGWLFGIARRVTADHLRRLERERRAMGRSPVAVEGASPGEALEMGEEAALLRRRFGQLSPSDREVLELRVLGGLSAEQAATALGKRPGAVRMAQSRALASLRRLMEQP